MKSDSSPFLRGLRSPVIRARMALWVVASLLLQPLLSAPPNWWQQRGLLLSAPTAPDDFAALNQGQLKNFVRAATYELHEKLPGKGNDARHSVQYL